MGGQTQLGFRVMLSDAYEGLDGASAWWHLSGEKAGLFLSTPVGTPLIRSLDHLMFGHGWDLIVSEGSLRMEVMVLLICRAVFWSVCEVAMWFPVTTRFPLAVHRTAASVAWGGVIVMSFLLMASQRISSLTQSFTVIPRCARSITRLGLGGLVPATAEYVRAGVGVVPLPFGGVWESGLVGVVDGFCMPASAFVSTVRVFCMSANGGVVEGPGFWAGDLPLFNSCWMMECDMKDWSIGFT